MKNFHLASIGAAVIASVLVSGCDRRASSPGEAIAPCSHVVSADSKVVEEICGPAGLFQQAKRMIEGRQQGVTAENRERSPGGVWSYSNPAAWADWLSVWANSNYWADRIDQRLTQPDAPDGLKPALHAYTRAARQAADALYQQKSGQEVNDAGHAYNNVTIMSGDPDPGPATTTACEAYSQTVTATLGMTNGLKAAYAPDYAWGVGLIDGDAAIAVTTVDYALGKLQQRMTEPALKSGLSGFVDATHRWMDAYQNHGDAQSIDAAEQAWKQARSQVDAAVKPGSGQCGAATPTFKQSPSPQTIDQRQTEKSVCQTYTDSYKNMDAIGGWFAEKTPPTAYRSDDPKTFGWIAAMVFVNEYWSSKTQAGLGQNTSLAIQKALNRVISATRELDSKYGQRRPDSERRAAADSLTTATAIASGTCHIPLNR